VAADNAFLFKLMIEEIVGTSLSTFGNVVARLDRIWSEIDFVVADAMVAVFVNFMLMWLLSPMSVPSKAPGLLQKLPANVFERGKFSLAQRLGCGVYKGSLFAMAGFFAAFMAASLNQGLSKIKRSMDPDMPEPKMSPLLPTCLSWALFMFVSSNPRYQLVAGIERVMFANLPSAVAKTGSTGTRVLNNIAGGVTWAWLAKRTGIQD